MGIGILMILLGFGLVLLNVISAAHTVYLSFCTATAVRDTLTKATVLPGVDAIKALTGLLNAIAKSPMWMATIIIGAALYWFGQRASGLAWPFN